MNWKRNLKIGACVLVALAVLFFGQSASEILGGVLWIIKVVGIVVVVLGLLAVAIFGGPALKAFFEKEPTTKPSRRTTN